MQYTVEHALERFTLDDAIEAVWNDRLSSHDFELFFAQWCKGKADFRMHNGDMQVFRSVPYHANGGYWQNFSPFGTSC